MVQKERETKKGELNGELPHLTKRERMWVENYPNGFDIPGNLKLANDFINTIPSGSKLLEVGCGPGRVLRHLTKHIEGVEAVGIDINKAAIDYASVKHSGIAKFRRMNGTELECSENSFDNVIMIGVVGGVEPEEREKLMAQAFRVVKPSGSVAIVEFKYNTDPDKVQKYKEAEDITHEKGTRIIKRGNKELVVKHFTEDELIELFAKAGFISVQTRGESIESAGIADPEIVVRRQYTVWGFKPLEPEVKN
jgi:ubiquinone/menaquinone biosynthesis C-methylase UbiE